MNYERFGIYDLRTIARRLGVHSPTTKKKKQLIEEIKKIKSGKLKPVELSKVGRPCIERTFLESGDFILDLENNLDIFKNNLLESIENEIAWLKRILTYCQKSK